jgi:large subunit ribosomal protein L24
MPKQKIRKGDLVQVITGRDKGLQGKVIQALPKDGKVIVEGVNRVKKHTKVGQTARGSKTGGIVTVEAPIQVSNVMLVVEHEGKKVVTRVGFRREEQERTLPDGSKKTVTRSVRFAKKTGEAI